MFKRREYFQDVLSCRDYSDMAVVSFAHQIQSKYYGENTCVSIESIELEHFSALPNSGINSSTK